MKNIAHASAADAQMGEYCFYRKLQTGAERVCIPNVRPQSNSPHAQACEAGIGTRSGIGINEDFYQ